jgi:UDP-N-acetylmuramate dehydrogenase
VTGSLFSEGGSGIDSELTQTFLKSSLPFRADVPLAPLTTSQTGGSARLFLEVNSVSELQQGMQLLESNQVEFRILGNGSNVLVPDLGVPHCVVKLGRGFRAVEFRGEGVFSVGGSMPLMTLARQCSTDGWSGLEFAGGIPALLGGAVKMNAGAHGGDCSTVVEAVEFVSKETNWEPTWLNAEELQFSYRHSSISSLMVVLGAKIKLVSSSSETCAANLAKHLEYRKLSQPLRYPSFGSVFKNPSPSELGMAKEKPGNNSAAWMIESVGLKGASLGGAMISDMHANWIVNPERKASTADMVGLIELAKKTVFQQYGILLREEVDIIC